VRGVQLGGGRGLGFLGNLVLLFDGFARIHKRLFKFLLHIVYLWQVLLDIPHHPRKHKKRKKVMRMNFHVVMYMLL
jgi:hypothetical protein